jgi:hypothetical protein
MVLDGAGGTPAKYRALKVLAIGADVAPCRSGCGGPPRRRPVRSAVRFPSASSAPSPTTASPTTAGTCPPRRGEEEQRCRSAETALSTT